MDLSSFLMSLAEMSHVASLVSVLTGFLLMVLYILRFMGQDLLEFGRGDAVTRIAHKPPQVDLQKKYIPCWIKNITSTENGVQLKIGCHLDGQFTVRSYWGVTVKSFHHILRSPWSWFVQTLNSPPSNLFGSEGCIFPDRIVHHSVTNQELSIELQRPEDKPELTNLGPAPRKSYPLVLIIMPQGGEEAMVVVIHVQDTVCRVSTHVLASFIKQRSGQCTHMVAMFSQTDAECVVCQELKVSRCILPCKHACVCHVCFQYLKNRCPLCRTFINSYFPIGEEPEQVISPATTSSSDQTNLVRRVVQALSTGIGVRENE